MNIHVIIIILNSINQKYMDFEILCTCISFKIKGKLFIHQELLEMKFIFG